MEKLPFGYQMQPPLTPEEREANYESIRASRARAIASDSARDTRSAILNCMGAWSEGVMAKHEVVALLELHEANLRRAWEHAELGRARQRAEDAIHGALRAVMEGKLL